jgi:hypothetical protein
VWRSLRLRGAFCWGWNTIQALKLREVADGSAAKLV